MEQLSHLHNHTGRITLEYWEKPSSDFAAVTGKPGHSPERPDGRTMLRDFSVLAAWTKIHDACIRGYVHPPATGDYTFTCRGGVDLYRQGQWDAAIERFRRFIQSSPRSELADNAQYWIGECYYNQGDYNRAIIELNEVLLKYPQGNRVPGALLALATAFADSGDPIDARLIVQKLISDHPESEEAKIGRQKLQALAE